MEKIRSIELPEGLINSFYNGALQVLGVILFVLLAWIFIKSVLFIVQKSLKLSKMDVWSNKLQDTLNLPIKVHFSKLISGFIKWSLILLAVMVGADTFQLSVISSEVGKVIAYLPKLVSGAILFVVGLYVASLVRKSCAELISSLNLKGSKVLGKMAYVLIFVFFSIMAINQLGINTDIITNNLLLIIGAFIASFAIAFGLGSRDIVLRLLLGFYSRKNFEIGNRVRIDDFEGVIVAMDNICMTVEADGVRTVYPIKMISNKKITILS